MFMIPMYVLIAVTAIIIIPAFIITIVNKVKGLTYQEYKDWCKEIGVK